jgi:hypothetical protein
MDEILVSSRDPVRPSYHAPEALGSTASRSPHSTWNARCPVLEAAATQPIGELYALPQGDARRVRCWRANCKPAQWCVRELVLKGFSDASI